MYTQTLNNHSRISIINSIKSTTIHFTSQYNVLSSSSSHLGSWSWKYFRFCVVCLQKKCQVLLHLDVLLTVICECEHKPLKLFFHLSLRRQKKTYTKKMLMKIIANVPSCSSFSLPTFKVPLKATTFFFISNTNLSLITWWYIHRGFAFYLSPLIRVHKIRAIEKREEWKEQQRNPNRNVAKM